jgi:putative FmdB family regulatory protein
MPFYEYECANCKFYTEVMQKISEPPLEKCPSCGKKALKKLVSAPVFRLKGGGWYETDFKSDTEGKRNIADREEPSAPKSEDTKSAGADSKPAASGEATGKSASGASEGAAKASATESRGGSSSGSGRGKATGTRSAVSRSKLAARSVSKSPSKARGKSPARKKGRR